MPYGPENPNFEPTPDWNLSTTDLIPILRQRANTEPVWNPLPVHFAIGVSPSNPFQHELLSQLSITLSDKAIGGTKREVPNRSTPQKERPNMIMMFGDGHLNAPVNTVPTYLALPTPKPPFLLVNTVDTLPPVDFALARTQLVAGACNNGVIFEGSPKGSVASGALWASMQGNHKEIRNAHPAIMDNIVRRILAHYGTTFVTERHTSEAKASFHWKHWEHSPIHQEVAEAASILGKAGRIQNKVDLGRFYDDKRHTFAIEKALNKSLGESMRAQYDPVLRVMGISISGGDKVKVSEDPREGHLAPVTQITPSGYVILNPRESLVQHFGNGSVETYEAGKIILFGSLALGGIVRTFQEAERWLTRQFQQTGAVDIVPAQLEPMITVIDHSHWHVEDYDENRVEVVKPDARYYPEDLDFACGTLDSANATASALFKSEIFKNPGPVEDPMRGKILIVELAGHGLIALGTDRQKVTEALTSENILRLKPPRYV